MLRTSPLPWKRDQYGNVNDATGERVSLVGCALATGRVSDHDECHGNTALLFAAPKMLSLLREVRVLVPAAYDLGDRIDTAIREAGGDA